MAFRLFGRPLWDWIRACGACSKALGPVDFFCDDCWRELRARALRGASLRQAGEQEFPVFAAWAWAEENDVYLRPLVYGLKGGWGEAIVEKLVEDVSFARASLPMRPREFTVVLPPRKPGRERDHAWLFATGFARIWGAPLWDGLAFAGACAGGGPAGEASGQSQKRKSAAERRKTRFSAKCPLPRSVDAWVMIDDVVTTGATARAVFEALGRPARFEVWALASRPALADIAGASGLC
jgi:predicted amidophosphoribosyltransferase